MTKACLLIVFNHRFDKNIPVLEKLYSPQFSHIYFLVPFYNGNNPRVIPVYESSHYFQSYFAQGYHRFFGEEFTHYIITGDDCLLNPAINENNFLEQLALPEKTDFIPEFIEFHKSQGRAWWHTFKAVDFFNNRKGAEIKKELPSYEEAVEKFRHHGLEVHPLTKQNIFGNKKPSGKKRWQYWLFKQYYLQYEWKKFKKDGKFVLPYPVVGSYSDVLIVTKESMYNFCRYCGIMAAAGLFVEIAIPTALLLASNKLVQEKDLRLQGKAIWEATEVEALENKFNRSIKAFMKGFPANQLFCHPVKLSKWNNDL